MFLQRYNPWGKTKREQLESWNILSFNPKKTDVDEHIDLINTLDDMIDQKEEAKMEKFIETMPTMIQTHLIICKDWAETKDKAKSLEHIIQKCDPLTPAIPLVTTGATIPGLYSHIAHSVDKDEAEIPPPFKGAKLKQTRGRGKPKENLKVTDKTHQKTKRQTNHTFMITLTITIITIMTLPQVRIKVTDLLMVKVVADNLEASHSKAEARDLSTINVNFRTTGFREAHIRVAVINTAATANPISREINLIPTEDKAAAGVLNKQEDTVVVGPITRVIIIITSISIILMISTWNSMAHPVAYAAVLIIPLNIATKENTI